MDESVDAPVAVTWRLRLANVAASLATVAVACALYCLAPYNQAQRSAVFGHGDFSISGAGLLWAVALPYGLAVGIYFATVPETRPSKSLRFWQAVGRLARAPATAWREHLAADDRLAVRATLLKGFFAPFMVVSLMSVGAAALHNGHVIAADPASIAVFRPWFDRVGFWFALQLILFTDILVFTLGYLIELPGSPHRIRSVDPTWTGWGAAMLCYPPFNSLSVKVLGSELIEFPQFVDPTAHLLLNATLLGLMAAYAWASVALGGKASNLTHRGIVGRGPYRVIRHPAYTCKNLAWWIGSLPLVSAAFTQSAFAGLQAVASVAGWTMLYVLRALTEEHHLRAVDGEYAAYVEQVRYRFVPGLL